MPHLFFRQIESRILRIFSLAFVLYSAGAGASGSEHARIEWDGFFARNLAVYNLFADAARQMPNEGLYPYDVITPLFSDYAEKHRFIYLPEGATMSYEADGPFAFPVGAALVKTFAYPHDFRAPEKGRRLIETRLLIHTPEGWQGAAYVWNDAQTEARLAIAGKRVAVSWTHTDGSRRGTDYFVPNMNQCKACHRGFGETAPLGPTARQLNRHALHGAENQIASWVRGDILKNAPDLDTIPRLAQWNDPTSGSLDDRVAGYLDINCAHCHNPLGLAGPTRLDLRLVQDDLHRRGVYYRATAAGNASRGRYFAIVPGNPEASFLLHRLDSTAPNIRMPEVGRTIVHKEGVALIAEWIRSLP